MSIYNFYPDNRASMKISAEDLPAIDFIDNVKSAVSDSVSLSAAITKTNGGDLRIRQNSTGRLGFKKYYYFRISKVQRTLFNEIQYTSGYT